MFDFANMGQWATFKEPAQLAAMEKHLEAKGVMAAHELQALFSVVRANDLIWSSVVSHYLLDKEAPPSDILHWFADGAHIPKAFLLEWTQAHPRRQRADRARRAGDGRRPLWSSR